MRAYIVERALAGMSARHRSSMQYALQEASRRISTSGSGVLVSEAVRNLLAGSEVHLTDRGHHQLKGVPGEVQLYAALA